MSPYRAPECPAVEPAPREPGAWYEVLVLVLLAWALAVARVTCALLRSEAPSREIDLAWLLVVLAPFVVWKEIAARRQALKT